MVLPGTRNLQWNIYGFWKVSFCCYWSILYQFLVNYCDHETDCTNEDEHSRCDCQSGTCICKLGFSKPKPGGKCEETGKHYRTLGLKSIFFQFIHFVSFLAKPCSKEADCTTEDEKSTCDIQKERCICLPGFAIGVVGLCGMYHITFGLKNLLFFVDQFFYHKQNYLYF